MTALDSLVGKTVASVTRRNMAGRDTYKDIVTWEETTIVFEDGTKIVLGGDDSDVYDPFEYEGFECEGDDDGAGEPIPVGGGPRPWET